MLQSVSACFEEHVSDNYLGAVSVADRFIGQSVETDDPFPVWVLQTSTFHRSPPPAAA